MNSTTPTLIFHPPPHIYTCFMCDEVCLMSRKKPHVMYIWHTCAYIYVKISPFTTSAPKSRRGSR